MNQIDKNAYIEEINDTYLCDQTKKYGTDQKT